MITVEKVLEIPKLRGLKVVAGQFGLQRQVRHVTVMEVPDIAKWLKGGDFLITSMYAFKDDIDAQCKLLTELALASCACVAIKTGQYIMEIDDRLKEIADQHRIPLLEIPYDLLYIEIIVNVMNNIFKEQNPRVVLEKYIKSIIMEGYTDKDMMVQKGQLLGLDIQNQQYMAMTFQFPTSCSPTEQERESLWHAGVSVAQSIAIYQGLGHCIAVNTESGSSILLDAATEEDIKATVPLVEREAVLQLKYSFPKQRIHIAYGNMANQLEGIRDTYFNSIRAIKTGQIFFPDQISYKYDDLKIHCIIRDTISQNSEIFQEVLANIDSKEILETLITYYESNSNLDLTASKLFAHRNTVKYRLQRVKELTGHDPRCFNDNIKLYMAAFAKKMHNKT